MCIAAAYGCDAFSFVAADTRYSYDGPDGLETWDLGGKVVRMKRGWASGTGKGQLMYPAWKAVAELDGGDTEAVRETFVRTARDNPDPPGRDSGLLVAHPGGAAGFSPDGRVATKGRLPLGLPYGLSDAEKEHLAENLWQYFEAARTCRDMLRGFAHWLLWCADRNDRVSREVEAGVVLADGTHYHLRAPADEVAKATVEGVGAMLQPA